jgi:hypothetical protein
MSDIEQRIRERAYQIWLEEGCPEGRELDHWNMATKLVAIEDGEQSTLKPIDENLAPAGKAIEPIEALRNAGGAMLIYPSASRKAAQWVRRAESKSSVPNYLSWGSESETMI